MAATARPLPQPDDSVSPGMTRLGRSRASRPEIDYRKLHRGTLTKERIPSQSAEKSSDVQESRLETILKAIAGVHDSVDERLALVQEAIDQVPDVGQVKEAVADEVREVVHEQLKVTVQHEIVHAIREEVKRAVQQQVSEVVRREVTQVMQREVKNIVQRDVMKIVTKQSLVLFSNRSLVSYSNRSPVLYRSRSQPSSRSSYPASNIRARTHHMPMSRARHPAAIPAT
jgi:hypothetical protein